MPKAKKEKSRVLDYLPVTSSVKPTKNPKSFVVKYSISGKSVIQSVEQLLRKTCPVDLPVTVIFRDLYEERLCGRCLIYTDKNNKLKRFEIEIDPRWPTTSSIDSLIHEWAHVMDNCRNGIARKRHRESWGACYAKAWHQYDQSGLGG
jgi:hypothetical protein